MCNLGLKQEALDMVVEKLNILIADEYVLLTKTLKYHWCVRGVFFGPLHALFQTQYEHAFATVDMLAERVRTLGGMPLSTLSEFVEHTRLEEAPGEYPDAGSMIADLVDTHEIIIQQIRDDVMTMEKSGDIGTIDMLTQLIQTHEKDAWFLRAHLENDDEENAEQHHGCCGGH